MPNLDKKANEKELTSIEQNKELESKLEEKLSTFNNQTDETEDKEDSTSDDEKGEDQTEDSKSEDDSTSDDEDKGDEDGSKDKDAPPEAKIPEGYVRAAKRQGWTDQDIKDEIDSNPDRALRLFQNCYETVNKATRDFAAIGRAKAETTRKEAEEKAKQEIKVDDYIKDDEIEKIADGDAVVSKTLKSLNEALKKRDIELIKSHQYISTEDLGYTKSDQMASAARAKAAADEADVMRINQFFGAENMKSYNEFYGAIKDGQNMGDLTPNQRDHRLQVLQVADQLIVGKRLQGMEISVSEALEDAHLLVTEPIREKVIVDNIRSSLKTRSKGKTLRPSDSKKSNSSTDIKRAKNREEAIANAELRLSKLNW